jgi:hypothetical protein
VTKAKAKAKKAAAASVSEPAATKVIKAKATVAAAAAEVADDGSDEAEPRAKRRLLAGCMDDTESVPEPAATKV